MNILLFTTTLLIAMIMLTYAKLDIYRNFNVLESQFKKYMEITERSSINQAAVHWYKKVNVSKRGGGDAQKAQGSSRLTFAYFIDKTLQSHKEAAQYRHLAKKLIRTLYHKSPFYQELMHVRPHFVDELLTSLQVADLLPKEKKLRYAKDLANLKLRDEVLDDAFYKMLKGTAEAEKSKQEFHFPEDRSEEEDEVPDVGLKEEYRSPAGYFSLLDYITLQKNTKVRVFLASKPLLLAIFENPETVDLVLATRQQLYQSVLKGRTTKEASELFKKQFGSIADRALPDILDFSVTKTNPKNYE